MTNKNRTTLYIGVTNNLCRRIYEHKNHLIIGSFTDKYNLEYCIYYEEFPYFDLAIQREKELKKWNRQKKEDLINKKNPEWKVLVTEKGFVREKVSFAQQVNDLLNELQHNGEIPPFSRKDNAISDKIPPSSRNDNAISDKIPPAVGMTMQWVNRFLFQSE
jgi:putative endonuclease